MALRRTPLLIGWGLLASCISSREVLRASDAGAPPPDVPFVPALALSAGVDHTCVVDSGSVRCTGSNRALALGLAGGDRLSLETLPTIDDALDVGAGYDFTCVLRNGSGRLACFGGNGRAQLGTGDRVARAAPTDVILSAPVVSFSAAFDHACAVLRTGALWCWGSNQEGELGQADEIPRTDRAIPVPVAPDTAFVEVSAGQGHTCAIAVDGGLYCMGRNSLGELGLGDGTPGQVAVATRVGSRRWSHVACGQNHTCAISADADAGTLYCWGGDSDNDGHPGPSALFGSEPHRTPTELPLGGGWTALSTDTFHTCALRAGELWCWGRNAEGQLGVGSMDVVPDPVHVEPDAEFTDVEVGRFHTCARRADGVVLCTGGNSAGELGVGELSRRSSMTVAE